MLTERKNSFVFLPWQSAQLMKLGKNHYDDNDDKDNDTKINYVKITCFCYGTPSKADGDCKVKPGYFWGQNEPINIQTNDVFAVRQYVIFLKILTFIFIKTAIKSKMENHRFI